MRSMISAVALAALAMGGTGFAHAQYSGQQYAGQPVRAAYTIEPFAPASTITIQGTGVRLRNEPFTQNTQILSHGDTGLPLTVVGIARLPDWNWYQVILKSGQKAFIRSDYTSAPSKGGASAPPLQQAAAPAQSPQLAAPLPPASRIDYGPPSASPAPVASPAPLTSQPMPASTPAPSYAPAPAYTAPAYTPGVPSYTPPAPVPPSTQPAGGSAISLVPRSPLPEAASPNSSGLASDPR
ncbi:MAG TPA: hypothetical protein VFV70_10545 [Hyphomonadaceae bacterium]|nr:hypothetical protein [Hyphomonadaceae bacterium]